MIRRPPRSTQGVSSAASDVYKRQINIGYNKYRVSEILGIRNIGCQKYLVSEISGTISDISEIYLVSEISVIRNIGYQKYQKYRVSEI